MKKSFYQHSQEIAPNIYLCANFRNDTFLILNKEIFELYEKNDFNSLKVTYNPVYQRLIDGGFLIENNKNEYQEILLQRQEAINSNEEYHLIVNPTLDCNLSCWYCYENKIAHSKMDQTTIWAVENNIKWQYEQSNYSQLKLSFFGGEPFFYYKAIKEIILFAKLFCEQKNIYLQLDFTTNGTLLNDTILDFLKDYPCTFQITLDGNKEQHNKIKYTKQRHFDAYSQTVRNIHKILDKIKNSYVCVRINFDRETLLGFDSILSDLQTLDRKRTKIILKKVWQVKANEISRDLILKVIDTLFANNFIIDYYMQGGVCFADRKNEAVINFDGNVFKCTTINRFDEVNALGTLDPNVGSIKWNEEKMTYTKYFVPPSLCQKCCMFPSCGGPCQKKLPNIKKWTCFLKEANLDIQEYILLKFRNELIKQNIYGNK